MKITDDTTLHRNLDNCPNLGIVIAADGVRLDLNGHRVDGDGKLRKDCPRNVLCDDGIVAIGQKNVTVTGGTVSEFAIGVFFGAGRHNKAANLKIARNQFPGALLAGSPGSAVRGCTVADNGLQTDQAGIVLFHVRNAVVAHNRINHNGDIGVLLDGSGGARLHDDLVINNPEAGFLLNGGRADVRRNKLSNDGDAIIVGGGSFNRVVGNRVGHSIAGDQSGGFGITVEAGHDNLVARNRVAGASTAGIRVGLPPAYTGGRPTSGDVIRSNLLEAGNRDGVLVMKTARRITLSRNRAHDSIDDGFDVESRSTPAARQYGERQRRPRDRGGARRDRPRRQPGGRQRRPDAVPQHRLRLSAAPPVAVTSGLGLKLLLDERQPEAAPLARRDRARGLRRRARGRPGRGAGAR